MTEPDFTAFEIRVTLIDDLVTITQPVYGDEDETVAVSIDQIPWLIDCLTALKKRRINMGEKEVENK